MAKPKQDVPIIWTMIFNKVSLCVLTSMMYHCITLHAGLLSCAGRLVWLGTRPATCIAAAGCWNRPWSFLSRQFVSGQLRGLHHNLAQEGCTVDGFLEKHPASHGPGLRFTQNIEAVLINWQHDSFLDTTKTCKRPRHLQHSIRMVSIAMLYRPFHCFDICYHRVGCNCSPLKRSTTWHHWSLHVSQQGTQAAPCTDHGVWDANWFCLWCPMSSMPCSKIPCTIESLRLVQHSTV